MALITSQGVPPLKRRAFIGQDAVCFIESALVIDEASRPTALALLQHPFCLDVASSEVRRVTLSWRSSIFCCVLFVHFLIWFD
jgi:hypothetical protein